MNFSKMYKKIVQYIQKHFNPNTEFPQHKHQSSDGCGAGPSPTQRISFQWFMKTY